MMRALDIREFAQRRPFKPFRLTLTDGRTYDVRHPDLVMVGRSTVIVGVPAADETEAVFDRAIHVDLLHIMEVELLNAPSGGTAGANGA